MHSSSSRCRRRILIATGLVSMGLVNAAAAQSARPAQTAARRIERDPAPPLDQRIDPGVNRRGTLRLQRGRQLAAQLALEHRAPQQAQRKDEQQPGKRPGPQRARPAGGLGRSRGLARGKASGGKPVQFVIVAVGRVIGHRQRLATARALRPVPPPDRAARRQQQPPSRPP
jgi:hypothetical protein